MAKKVDLTLEDASALLIPADKYKTELAEAGMKQEDIDNLKSLIEILRAKDTAQKGTKGTKLVKTSEQDKAMKQAAKIINRIKKAVKGVFSKDKAVQKEFHVGNKIPGTVAKMNTELEHYENKATEYLDKLAKKGIKQSDVEKLEQARVGLMEADAVQESTRKLVPAATMTRNQALKELKEQVFQIRNSAELVFEDKPEILKEFETIIRKSAKKKSEPTAPPPTS